ncbi:branched chain amino acid aminotransferase apoenzyme [Chloracidobacterium thermophilum B]|uniref:Branched-chain-amino-acid aminotransferase n=2 Tax=Acidobacteriaceae TaxID=204434 RepID=G2LFM4_CHLTF|nr:branched chain amino acid aminotransferase apoenzyme [Chloracidobacterium thermophilum B]
MEEPAMALETSEKIWHNGKLLPWEDARIHVMSHVIHYGSSVFEGIRCYQTPRGPRLVRLREHVRRLFDSCHIYRMTIPFTMEQIFTACIETVRVNKLQHCYVRPIVFRGYGAFGVNPFPAPVETYIICFPWGRYLGSDALEAGVDVCTSSWARMSPNTLPTTAKAGANYMNSQLIKMEAIVNGYAEGIALDAAGYVSEGSGENVFMVRDGTVITPPIGRAVLPGITRDAIMRLCEDLGIPVVERSILREELYIADEVFLTGTACEITPVRTLDKIKIGEGKRGPITKQLQDAYFGIIHGEREDRHEWLTAV